MAKLSAGQPRSISQLTDGSRLTRQAITKHLRVLEKAALVHSVRAGRESLFAFDPKPIEECKRYLDLVSEQWDLTLCPAKDVRRALMGLRTRADDGASARDRSTAGPRQW